MNSVMFSIDCEIESFITFLNLLIIAYTYLREHGGLRQIAGLGVTITRGAASVFMFCYATILLTMCRNIITFLRETFLHRFVPFDGAVSMHKYIAFWAFIMSSM
jgi:dual oxidase